MRKLRTKADKGDTTGQIKRWKSKKVRWRKKGHEVYLEAKEQCPAWSDESKILGFYELARSLKLRTGQKWTVDHVIPLRGEFVCGLHNEFNLDVMLQAENLAKSNRVNLDS